MAKQLELLLTRVKGRRVRVEYVNWFRWESSE